jgi:hypothetical protein
MNVHPVAPEEILHNIKKHVQQFAGAWKKFLSDPTKMSAWKVKGLPPAKSVASKPSRWTRDEVLRIMDLSPGTTVKDVQTALQALENQIHEIRQEALERAQPKPQVVSSTPELRVLAGQLRSAFKNVKEKGGTVRAADNREVIEAMQKKIEPEKRFEDAGGKWFKLKRYDGMYCCFEEAA